MQLRSLGGLYFGIHSTVQASRLRRWMSSFLEVRLQKGRCEEVLRGRTCPRCHKKFFICRHCDRGHVYCCKQCSQASRCEKCRIYRRRHRQSPLGRADHRDCERARRRRLILGKETVVDQTSGGAVASARVSARVRMAAVSAVIGGIFEEETRYEKTCCEMCGRLGRYVRFGNDMFERRKRKSKMRFSV